MKQLRYCLGAWLLAAGCAHAENFQDYPDLPPQRQVAAAMAIYPGVQAAKSGIKFEESNAARLRYGPYEYNVRMAGQQRRDNLAQHFNEWDVTLERAVRLPGKVALDRQIGEESRNHADFAMGDAMHDAGRTLLKQWFAWVRAGLQVQDWQKQIAVLGQQLDAVNRRLRAGDAPKLEASLAEAALAQADYGLQQALLKQALAENDIRTAFGDTLVLPPQPVLAPPQPLENSLDYWRERVLTNNHELGMVRTEMKRAQLQATRAESDQSADPSIGVRYASERSGAERITGLLLNIPFGGGARQAAAQGMQAKAEVAAQREAATVRRLNVEATGNYLNAKAAYDSAQKARAVANGMQKNADLMSRAYSLGEINLAEVLTARRLALESNVAAALAQADAAEAKYRLMLDAHLLWPLDHDD